MSATGCILSNVSLVFYHGNGLLKSGLKSGMIPFITVGPLCSLCSAPKNWVAEWTSDVKVTGEPVRVHLCVGNREW